MVHPIQPYFAISADKYYKRPLSATGIAHMYEYTCLNNSDNTTIAIPDGCIDVMFDTSSDDAAARTAGTVLTGTRVPMEQGHTYFGIRFKPGVMPVFLDGTFRELEDFTGYTSRCIDKIFKAYAGMSPKAFARIIRFQRTIDHLDRDNTILFTDLAADGGGTRGRPRRRSHRPPSRTHSRSGSGCVHQPSRITTPVT